MEKVRYTQEPEPVTVDRYVDYVQVRVACHAQKTSDEPEMWEADECLFCEREDALDIEDVVAQPEKYLDYCTLEYRRKARQEAQDMVDLLREAYPTVPAPWLGAGARVCNRPSDGVMLLGLAQMGTGAELFELADGTVVSLTHEDVLRIFAAVKEWQTAVQTAKQKAWQRIDATVSEAEVTAALAELRSTLEQLNGGEEIF